jgi:ethanolamine utilization protein EutN
MVLGMVIGHATATVKHPSLVGLRMPIVQVLNSDQNPEGDMLVAVDRYGAGQGQVVILNSDGKGAREYVGNEKSPARWYVVGLVDPKSK